MPSWADISQPYFVQQETAQPKVRSRHSEHGLHALLLSQSQWIQPLSLSPEQRQWQERHGLLQPDLSSASWVFLLSFFLLWKQTLSLKQKSALAQLPMSETFLKNMCWPVCPWSCNQHTLQKDLKEFCLCKFYLLIFTILEFKIEKILNTCL